MIIQQANICDICKSRMSQSKCEICQIDICNACCSSKHINVRGIKVFEYAICRDCNKKFEGLKMEIVIKPETISDIKNQINEQLKKAVCVNALKQDEPSYY